MKHIPVSAAIIVRTNPQTHKKELFATQRGYGDFKGGWEFPGGQDDFGKTRGDFASAVTVNGIL